MQRAIGLDFGTTNSALAVVEPDGSLRLAAFPALPTFRSALFFRPALPAPYVSAGPRALLDYLEAERPKRFVQSLKSYLTDDKFTATRVYDRNYRLEDLVGTILRKLRDEAEPVLGELGRRVTVGRPVHYVGRGGAEAEELALARMRRALAMAGFDEVRFLEEPVAAAHAYRQRVEREEVALIADFGGGTTDLSLVRVRPGAGGGVTVLGTAGVPVGGDAFDGRIVQHAVAPLLGDGMSFRSPFGRNLPVPAWLYHHLRRWHHVSFLRTHKTLTLLREVAAASEPRAPIDALAHLVEADLGFELFGAIERCKFELSRAEKAELRFEDGPVEIRRPIARDEFDAWIAPELDEVGQALDGLLRRVDLADKQVDAVFLTGGSAYVPGVRARFAARYGTERLRGGEELTTVVAGLALHAARPAES